jgi:2',3'-cyclic-nucleotide 2'-phosphodiesterase (5'-nucleotidase family)
MRVQFVLWIILLSILASCKSYQFTQYHNEQIKITDSLSYRNQAVADYIKVYRDSLDKEMNVVIGTNDHTASKDQPESELGNLLADALLEMSRKYTKAEVNLAVINQGGIRLPQLAAGEIKLGTVYELMPFDNLIVILTIDGKSLHELFDKMAEIGGWPISGATYNIKSSKAENITIGGVPIDETKFYRLAISDYLANGGDKLEMLKGLKQEQTGVLLRDAFIEYFKEKKVVITKKDGRVTK